MDRRFTVIAFALALFGITLLAYWPATVGEFLNFDDGTYVVNNRHVRNGLSAADARWAFTSFDAANWHPLTWLSLALDAQLFGPTAYAFHRTNVVLHALNAAFLFLAFWHMTRAPVRSVLIAALFALHPLRVESVAWVAERKDVLSTLFWMLALWAYAVYADRPGRGRYLIVLLAFALGLMAKPMLVTLPCVLLLLDYWPLQRIRFAAEPVASGPKRKSQAGTARPGIGLRRAIVEKIPLGLLAAACSFLTFRAQASSPAVRSLEEFPFGVRLANALVAYWVYICKTLWPSKLAILYPLQRGGPPGYELAGAIFALAAISVLVLYLARRFAYLPVGWCWYLGTLVPVIGLVQVGMQALADRYSYIPSIGLFIMIVWGGAALAIRYRCEKLALGAATVWLITLTWLTQTQIGYWKDSFSVWSHALDVTSNNYIAHTNLGTIYDKKQQLPEAQQQFEAALRVNPQDNLALDGLTKVAVQQGRIPDAFKHAQAALAIDPNDATAHFNLALVLMIVGDFDRAVPQFQAALAAGLDRPEMPPALEHAAWRLATDPDAEARRRHARAALELALRASASTENSDPKVLATLAAAYAANDDFARAVSMAQQAAALVPSVRDPSLSGQIAAQLNAYRQWQLLLPPR